MVNLIKNDNLNQLVKNELNKNGLSKDDIKIIDDKFVEIKPLGIVMDFSFIACCLWDQAIKALHEKDILSLLILMNSEVRILFVYCNIHQLKKIGLYEEALLIAFTGIKYNFTYILPLVEIKYLFYIADKEKLCAAGHPLPEEKDSYILYRGVAGKGPNRRKRSISWTSSFEIAKWFATRFSCELPMVYTAELPRDNIYAYSNERQEEEFLCNITNDIDLIEVWRDDSGEFKPMKNPVFKEAS